MAVLPTSQLLSVSVQTPITKIEKAANVLEQGISDAATIVNSAISRPTLYR